MSADDIVPESVLAVAKAHVSDLRPVEGFVWKLSRGRQVAAGWYFDYEAERLPTTPTGSGTSFGSAPGFLVVDDGSVRVVGWRELHGICGR